MRLIFTYLILAIATPLAAQDLPGLFDVSDVADDDVLNVRENPRASAPKVGELAPDATGIEVVTLSDSGDWGWINSGEGGGWVNMAFMAAQANPAGATDFERPLHCTGTEPFWSLGFDGSGAATFAEIDAEDATFAVTETLQAQGVGRFAQAARADGGYASGLVAVLKRTECSDGMSDRRFGFSVDLLFTTPEQPSRLLTGCCSLELPR